jgi:hypothetical protein
MNPHLVPPVLVNEIVNGQEADIVIEVMLPVFPVVRDGEQPLTV